MCDGAESWTLLDDGGEVVSPVEAFLAHLQALDRSPTTIWADAFRLRWWFEFLAAVGLVWDQARADCADGARARTAEVTTVRLPFARETPAGRRPVSACGAPRLAIVGLWVREGLRL